MGGHTDLSFAPPKSSAALPLPPPTQLPLPPSLVGTNDLAGAAEPTSPPPQDLRTHEELRWLSSALELAALLFQASSSIERRLSPFEMITLVAERRWWSSTSPLGYARRSPDCTLIRATATSAIASASARGDPSSISRPCSTKGGTHFSRSSTTPSGPSLAPSSIEYLKRLAMKSFDSGADSDFLDDEPDGLRPPPPLLPWRGESTAALTAARCLISSSSLRSRDEPSPAPPPPPPPPLLLLLPAPLLPAPPSLAPPPPPPPNMARAAARPPVEPRGEEEEEGAGAAAAGASSSGKAW